MLSSLRIDTFNSISWKGSTSEVYVVWKQSLPVYHYHHCRHHHRRHNRYSHNRKNFCQTWTVQGGLNKTSLTLRYRSQKKIKTGSYIFHKRRLRFLNGSYITFSGVTVQYVFLLITSVLAYHHNCNNHRRHHHHALWFYIIIRHHDHHHNHYHRCGAALN